MNILIIGLILVILFLLLGCKNNEGFAELGRTPADGIPTAFGTVTVTVTGEPVSLTALTTSNYCADNKTFNTAKYIAFIDATALKIANKKTGSDWVNSKWQVIWSSELSNPLWVGPTVTFASNSLTIGTQPMGSDTLGTAAKLTDSGDLVIVDKDNKILWSLVGQELETAKKQLNDYYTLSEHSDRSAALLPLQKKLTNFSTYIKAVGLNTNNPASAELMKAHAMLVQARHQMDFDLSELNGVANSKVVSSQNGVNSSLYVNLMATTLAVSLFLLVATRGNQGFP